jgi:hypothetical protein
MTHDGPSGSDFAAAVLRVLEGREAPPGVVNDESGLTPKEMLNALQARGWFKGCRTEQEARAAFVDQLEAEIRKYESERRAAAEAIEYYTHLASTNALRRGPSSRPAAPCTPEPPAGTDDRTKASESAIPRKEAVGCRG